MSGRSIIDLILPLLLKNLCIERESEDETLEELVKQPEPP